MFVGGAAALQERTRTHAHARIGHFEHFRRVSVCAFLCASLCRFMLLHDVVLPWFLTVWACCVGFASASCFVFLLFVSIFICRVRRFRQKCKYSLRQRIQRRAGGFL